MIIAMLAGSIGVVPVIIFLIVVGFFIWLFRAKMNPTFYAIIIFLVCLMLGLWLLDAFGIYPLPAAFRIKG